MLGATRTSGSLPRRQLDLRVGHLEGHRPGHLDPRRPLARVLELRVGGDQRQVGADAAVEALDRGQAEPLALQVEVAAAVLEADVERPLPGPPDRPARAACAAAAARSRRTAGPARPPGRCGGSASPAARRRCSAASAGARVRMSLTATCGRISSSSGSSARAASAACWPSAESGSGGGNIRYSSAAAKPSPAPSTAARRSSQVSTTTSCPRPASARPSAIAGKTCPGSPKAATRTRRDPRSRQGCRYGCIEALAGPGEDDLRDVAVGRGAEQEAHRLAEVAGLDHRLAGDLALGELGHRRCRRSPAPAPCTGSRRRRPRAGSTG